MDLIKMKSCLLILLCLFSSVLIGQNHKHGEVSYGADQWTMWSEEREQWVPVMDFWLDYVKKNGGLTWGKSSQYPEYSQVKEYDTFLVETAHGVCLMEFFHQRWRRANDVRRWDEALNNYAGCSHVFD